MDYQELFRKKELYSRCRESIPEFTMFTFERAFEIEYSHNSTAEILLGGVGETDQQCGHH